MADRTIGHQLSGEDATVRVLAEIPFHVTGQPCPCRIVGEGEKGLEVLLHELVEHRLGRSAALYTIPRALL